MAFKWAFNMGSTVYAEKDGAWAEGMILGAQYRGVETYSIKFVDPDLGWVQNVPVERIKNVDDPFIQNNAAIKKNVYDVSTQEGVDEMVAAHNKWRAEVGVPPVVWDAQLAKEAQAWADHLLKIDVMKHSQGEDGENLYWSSRDAATPTQVVDAWGSEKPLYDGRPIGESGMETFSKYGHYTQMVWRETTKIGAGVAKDGDDVYWVCRYEPAGNTMGKMPY